jgi:hypothetical protein
MKRLLVLTLILCAAAAPVAGSAAAMPLVASQIQRQSILDTELALNVPGMSADAATSAQNRISQLQTQVNGSDLPALPVPVYGSCDADQSTLSYLQDQVNSADLDLQTLYTYERNIYDLQVNLRQRGC